MCFDLWIKNLQVIYAGMDVGKSGLGARYAGA
jgi:hypothetical protein